MKSNLLDLTTLSAQLISLPRKPPAPNHPWRKSLKNWQTKKINDNGERNSQWLNDWKPIEYETVMWTKIFYSLDKLQEYGYRVDKDDGRAEQVKTHFKF